MKAKSIQKVQKKGRIWGELTVPESEDSLQERQKKTFYKGML